MSKNAASEIPATGLPSRRRPTHPGIILLEAFLREILMSQAEAARRMNMPVTRVNELVRGKRGVTARSALRLGRLLGTTPMFWMNLQAKRDLWHAQQEERQPRRTPSAPSPDRDRDHGLVDRPCRAAGSPTSSRSRGQRPREPVTVESRHDEGRSQHA